MRRVRALAAFLLAAAMLAGCTQEPVRVVPYRPLTVLTWMQFRTTDPVMANDEGAATLVYHAYQRLVTIEPGTETVRGDAADCKFVSRLDYQCKLFRGVTMSNGVPVTPEAVKFSLDRARRLARPGMPAQMLTTIDEVTVVDEKTVNIRLKQPDSNLAYALASPAASIVFPPDFSADSPRSSLTPPVTSGPWSIAHTDLDELQLVVNKKYAGVIPPWRPPVLTFRSIGDPAMIDRFVDSERIEALWGTTLRDPAPVAGWPRVTYPLAERSRLQWNIESPQRSDDSLRAFVRDATAPLRTQTSHRPAPLVPQIAEYPTTARPTPPAHPVRLTLGHFSRDQRATELADRVAAELQKTPGVQVEVRRDDNTADLWLSFDRVTSVATIPVLQQWIDFPLPGREQKIARLTTDLRASTTVPEREKAIAALLRAAAEDATIVPLTQNDQVFPVRTPPEEHEKWTMIAGPDHQFGGWELTW